MKCSQSTMLLFVTVSLLVFSLSLAQDDQPAEDSPSDVYIDETNYENVDDPAPEESLQDVRALDDEENEFEEREMDDRSIAEGIKKILPYYGKAIKPWYKARFNRDYRTVEESKPEEVAPPKASETQESGPRKSGPRKFGPRIRDGPRKPGRWIYVLYKSGRRGPSTMGPTQGPV